MTMSRRAASALPPALRTTLLGRFGCQQRSGPGDAGGTSVLDLPIIETKYVCGLDPGVDALLSESACRVPCKQPQAPSCPPRGPGRGGGGGE